MNWLGWPWLAALALPPVALVYAALIWYSQRTALAQALLGGVTTAVGAGLAVALVWKLGARMRTGQWSGAAKLGVHFALGALFSVLWAAFIAAAIGFAKPDQARTFLAGALGWQVLLGMLLYGFAAGMAHLYQTTRELHEAEAAALRAQLHALRAQLNPHFLFNTLNSLVTLVREDPTELERALERFAWLLRYVLDSSAGSLDDVTLERELQFIRSYLDLERLRFGSRLTVVEEVDDEALDTMVPALTLQPLVENAIQHGIGPSVQGGTIRITARCDGAMLMLTVSDNGVGTADPACSYGTGIGLHIVRQRLLARYGAAASLNAGGAVGAGFTARVTVPVDQPFASTPA